MLHVRNGPVLAQDPSPVEGIIVFYAVNRPARADAVGIVSVRDIIVAVVVRKALQTVSLSPGQVYVFSDVRNISGVVVTGVIISRINVLLTRPWLVS